MVQLPRTCAMSVGERYGLPNASRIVIVAGLVALVAVVLPGAWEYLTVKACLGTGILTPSGSYCPQGEMRLPVLAVQWVRAPTVASSAAALFVAIVVSCLFTLRDRRTRSRVAG
jgi:hypothetical protein